jgi:dihydroorotate dehydrogenase (NAD+) catalytic subunit
MEGVHALEMNISCPNLHRGGAVIGQDAGAIIEFTKAARERSKKPLIVKLSPNVTDIVGMAKAAKAGGADAVSCINTLVGMKIDIETRRPVLGKNTGGLSGPAIKPVALAMVWRVAGEAGIDVMGIGGIDSAEDALEFLIAGAKAIQVGTALFANPRAPIEILEGLQKILARWGVGDINEIIGTIKEN